MVFGFLFYFCQYAVLIFFNSALVAAVMIRLEGGDPTLADGFNAAKARIPAILGYAAIAATVGVLLQSLKNSIAPSRSPPITAWIQYGSCGSSSER